ncbi:MAG: terminase [Microvirga sp.]|jgi:hypothetical protein|nr:terminase [Microvirga sp.]
MRSDEKALLLLTSRQVGKSHVVSLRAAYRARFMRRRVGIVSPTQRQSNIVYGRVKEWVRRDGKARLARDTATVLELEGGGAVVSFPGDRPDVSVRGETLDDLIVDEAAQVKDSLIAAATPTTAARPDASIIYLSTPFGARGAFYKAWQEEDVWTKITVGAEECSRIRPDFLAKEKVRLGILWEQEYACRFLASVGGLFDPLAIDDLFSGTPQTAEMDWVPRISGDARDWL